MNRRGFLRRTFGAVAAVLVPAPVWALIKPLDTFEISEQVGAWPLRNDITVLPADDPRKLKLGWVIYEEVGIVVVNDYNISKISV